MLVPIVGKGDCKKARKIWMDKFNRSQRIILNDFISNDFFSFKINNKSMTSIKKTFVSKT